MKGRTPQRPMKRKRMTEEQKTEMRIKRNNDKGLSVLLQRKETVINRIIKFQEILLELKKELKLIDRTIKNDK